MPIENNMLLRTLLINDFLLLGTALLFKTLQNKLHAEGWKRIQ